VTDPTADGRTAGLTCEHTNNENQYANHLESDASKQTDTRESRRRLWNKMPSVGLSVYEGFAATTIPDSGSSRSLALCLSSQTERARERHTHRKKRGPTARQTRQTHLIPDHARQTNNIPNTVPSNGFCLSCPYQVREQQSSRQREGVCVRVSPLQTWTLVLRAYTFCFAVLVVTRALPSFSMCLVSSALGTRLYFMMTKSSGGEIYQKEHQRTKTTKATCQGNKPFNIRP